MIENMTMDKSETDQAPGKTVRGFRGSPEVENFYRFVNEFKLRREARLCIEVISERLGIPAKKEKKKRGRKKKQKVQ